MSQEQPRFRLGRAGVVLAGLLAFATMAAFAALAVLSYDTIYEDAQVPQVSQLPPATVDSVQQEVFRWKTDACEPGDIPDLPARAFRDYRGRVVLIASHFVSRRMTGASLDELSHDCAVIMRSGRSSRRSSFDNAEWIAAPYTFDGRTVYALVHNEFHGTGSRACPSGDYIRCWYNGITLGISRDGGRTFSDARKPPTHLVGAVPYRYVPDQGPVGLFEPTNIIRGPGGYYYTLARVRDYRRLKYGNCLLRTRHINRPSSWRGWDGSGFGVRFVNPYERPRAFRRAAHLCHRVDRRDIASMTGSLSRSTYFGKYILVGTAGDWDPSKRRIVWGVYYSLSDDLIHWDRRRLIREAELPWTYRCGDRNPILYPSLIDPQSRSRNFETVGRRPYLYFTQNHFAKCRQTLNRDLVRVRVLFNRR